MQPEHTIEVVDRNGWRKQYTVNKAIIHVGSDAQNDIALDAQRGSGVASRHVQLIAQGTNGSSYRLVNLGGRSIALERDGQEHTIEPRSSIDVGTGASVHVGEFTLILHGGDFGSVPREAGKADGAVGLRLNLPRTTLRPDHPIDGAVSIRNLGDETAVQFELEVHGLETECYELGPAPILFPGASKEIFFRIHHPRGPALRAGEHRISVRAAAPESYPGESATVTQTIRVLPFYSHAVRLTAVER